MLSFKTTLLAAAAMVIAGVHGDYYIEPNSVPLTTRKSWCFSQTSQCPLICLDTAPGSGKPLDNSCATESLTYGCVCGNGLAPNVSEYSLTLPYYTCQQYQINCVKACGSNNICAASCTEDNPCGAQSPTRVTTTTSGLTTPTPTPSSAEELPFGGNANSNNPGSGAGGLSTSLQASLTLATALTALLVGPFLMM